MAGFPNSQSNPASAIPVWVVGGAAAVPPGATFIEYAQVATLAASTPITPPDGATIAVVQVNNGVVRYRRDGVAPTGTVGMLAYATAPAMVFYAPFDDLAFIQATGSTGSLNIEWYGF